ncbi:MAG: hypothetical protein CBE00_11270 [Planctomycetaceae bacterium TMED240]|nr:MAG: hypothetical protein CBE00_11270 [Planctomycetaceae bacterium TMED240]
MQKACSGKRATNTTCYQHNVLATQRPWRASFDPKTEIEVKLQHTSGNQIKCRRIKKAPGKYVVLGGRRTTRLKSREPVDWSSI